MKRPRGRPRRQPLVIQTPTPSGSQTVETESEMCENTPPNTADKRKSQADNDSQSGSESESKRQRVDEDGSEDVCAKYQQYWNKHCSTRLQTKLVEASKNSPNVCSQNNDNSNKSDEPGTR